MFQKYRYYNLHEFLFTFLDEAVLWGSDPQRTASSKEVNTDQIPSKSDPYWNGRQEKKIVASD